MSAVVAGAAVVAAVAVGAAATAVVADDEVAGFAADVRARGLGRCVDC